MADFTKAPEVEFLARQLIPKYHEHLASANIAYLFRRGKWKSKGSTVLGKAAKVTGQHQYLTSLDFIITINEQEWRKADPATKEAILDHELAHCGMDGTGWVIHLHDVEDFASVIRRRGLWSEGLQLFKAASERYEQESLFPKAVQKKAAGSEQ